MGWAVRCGRLSDTSKIAGGGRRSGRHRHPSHAGGSQGRGAGRRHSCGGYGTRPSPVGRRRGSSVRLTRRKTRRRRGIRGHRRGETDWRLRTCTRHHRHTGVHRHAGRHPWSRAHRTRRDAVVGQGGRRSRLPESVVRACRITVSHGRRTGVWRGVTRHGRGGRGRRGLSHRHRRRRTHRHPLHRWNRVLGRRAC